jgi:hypothetical protein
VLGQNGTVMEIFAQTDALDLSKFPIEGEAWRVDLTGKALLDVDLEVDTEDIAKSRGHIKLDVADLVLSGGEALGSKFEEIAKGVFPATFTEAVLEFAVEDGKAEVTRGSFLSEPVELEVSGDIQLKKDLSRSRINLEIKLKLADSLDKLARLAPMMSSNRDEDGTYHLNATGTVTSPRLKEERGTKTGSTSRRATREPDENGGALGGGTTTEERAKARQERLERIKERKERTKNGSTPTANGRTLPMPGPGGIGIPMGDEPFPDEGPMDMEEEGPEPYMEEEPLPELPPELEEPQDMPYAEQ